MASVLTYIILTGCLQHCQPCGTGDLDGGPERAENFMKVVDEMRFAFVEVTGKEAAYRIVHPYFIFSYQIESWQN